jgi:hypothetical protein
MFSWEVNAVEVAKSNPEAVWNVYKDVSNWPSWDEELTWSRLDGKFAEGTKGTLKPKGWFASDFTILEIVPNEAHSDVTHMPFTTLVFSHKLKKISETHVQITHHVKVSGLLAPLLALTMRFQFKKSVPKALKNLVKKVEKLA